MRMTRHNQSGSALVTGLVFLVVIIMLGLSASSGSIQQEMGVRNVRDQNIAMEAADAALRAAETWLRNNGGPLTVAYSPVYGSSLVKEIGFCNGTATTDSCAEAGSAFWNNDSNAVKLGGTVDPTPDLKLVDEQPRYIIELFYICPTCEALGTPINKRTRYYRITARGVGMNKKTYRTVQSIYRY